MSACSVTKSWPTLCDPMGSMCSPPSPSVHGISQARTLEWVAISFSRGSSWLKDWACISCIGRWILHHWVTWEAPLIGCLLLLLSCKVVFDSATSWPAQLHSEAHQAPLSSPISPSLLRFMPTEWVMLSNHLILGCSLLKTTLSPTAACGGAASRGRPPTSTRARQASSTARWSSRGRKEGQTALWRNLQWDWRRV